MILKTKYGDELSLYMQMKKFENVISLEKVNQLAEIAQKKFKTEANNIRGG